MLESEESTTISLKKGTRNRLKECGKKGESWDALLIRLIDVYIDYEAHQWYEGKK